MDLPSLIGSLLSEPGERRGELAGQGLWVLLHYNHIPMADPQLLNTRSVPVQILQLGVGWGLVGATLLPQLQLAAALSTCSA